MGRVWHKHVSWIARENKEELHGTIQERKKKHTVNEDLVGFRSVFYFYGINE